MADLIERQAAIDAMNEHRTIFCNNSPESFRRLPYGDKCRVDEIDNAVATIVNLPSVQSEIIRCKDCKHKPTTTPDYKADNGDCGFEIEFPDYRCPCQCDDGWYNRLPDDDWFCGNAERKET